MAETNYTGWKKWYPTDEEWIEFYKNQSIPFSLLENEYLIIYDQDQNASYYCYENGKLRQIRHASIRTCQVVDTDSGNIDYANYRTSGKYGDKKLPKKYSKGKSQVINPRNDEQTLAIDLLKDPNKTIKLIEGRYGSGKSFLVINAALEALNQGLFEKIVWVRNTVDVIGTKDLGALPGEISDKLAWTVAVFSDIAGTASVNTMLSKGTLVVEPLQFIRGRSFENSLIICTEAENLLLTNLQLIIARAAEGSQIWLDGDFHQTDRKMFADSDGLTNMKEAFKGNKLFGCVTLLKNERSATAAMADLLDEKVAMQKAKLLK